VLNQTFLAWASLIGTVVSVVGFGVAIWQLRRTAKAAKAAELASTLARAAVSESVLLTELASCIRSIEEIKAHLRTNRLESALLRVIDTRSSLVQFRSMQKSAQLRQAVLDALTQLAELRDLLEGSLATGRSEVDTVEAIRALSGSSDVLNEWLGNAKYLTKGNTHDP